ncbi:hypothetical protein [Candidatus Sneabacter namystus]|uniref:Uncharacterized protein n=1 Tax=Candidatus Sneabacter namystus TaxID=2601646 RepID=A0A5C0UHW7_9RICK|nr:hypothetical protein [Candidatus Sneabacter namystus]QEK39357.1 hypothetical protein FZC37_00130 [Candidatus Sneabacter namystus]
MLPHYLDVLEDKKYRYRKIVLPHDQARRNAFGTTVLMEADSLAKEKGLPPIEIGKMIARDTRIYQALDFLASGKCFIDEGNCKEGIEGLEGFMHEKRSTHSASTKETDIADSFCYMASDAKANEGNCTFLNSLDKLPRDLRKMPAVFRSTKPRLR